MQNTADYEQEVLIERFPYKKCFNVDQTNFVVGPGEVVTLTLTWTPQDGGGCREMILFHINEVYRLQAYVFGTAEDPKPVKKGVSTQNRCKRLFLLYLKIKLVSHPWKMLYPCVFVLCVCACVLF